MKRSILLLSFFACLAGCQPERVEETPGESVPVATIPPAPGTVVLADSLRIPDDLNTSYFSVKLVANEYTRQGTYDVQILYGQNDATTQITFPRGGTERIIPAMKKGSEPFSFIIGFRYGEADPEFYEYYLVKGAEGRTETKYLKAYSFK